jgi:predicted patatin/cPLA2 family phospholipase
MDIIKSYFIHISRNQKIDNYKIITFDNKTDYPFLLTDNKSILTSQSLIKLLKLDINNANIFDTTLNNESDILKEKFNKVLIESSLLYEDIIFYNFDPYSNFLLPEKSNMGDIKDIINKTQTYFSLHENHISTIDYSEYVNPYGLEKVVFAGGGTKGVIYIGTLIGLFMTGQLYYINHYAGTSIGSLTAMVLGCITPPRDIYINMKTTSLKNIMKNEQNTTGKYQEAIKFVISMFYGRTVDSFYNAPIYTLYGIWTALDKIMKENGLYDPTETGFQIWYALICKKICHIMGNGLDELVVIEKNNGGYVEFGTTEEKYLGGIDIFNDDFKGWKIISFFSFDQYNKYTGKTLVLTGTNTAKIETVYYTHTNIKYSNLSVLLGATASMSIPWVFKAPIINGSYNFDGGLFDNYPITHCDIKTGDIITKYNNKIFGYLIDDKNTVIYAYELIRELWIAYDGFIDVTKIIYLSDAPTYIKISQLFFELRLEFYKLIYYTDNNLETFMNTTSDIEEIKSFNIRDLDDILTRLSIHSDTSNYINFTIPKIGINKVIELLNILDIDRKSDTINYKIGKKTDISDILVLSIKQGIAYSELNKLIMEDLKIIENMEVKIKIVIRYEKILNHIMQFILAYYELKGNFVHGNNINNISKYLLDIVNNIDTKLNTIDKLINTAIIYLSKHKNQYIQNQNTSIIKLVSTSISKIFTRSSNNEVRICDEQKSPYRKAIDYFFNSDMSGIIYKYTCIANDRICNDSINRMRTIKLNTFETQTLHFNMQDDLISRLIYEGYSKTIKYFTNILHIMEITGKTRPVNDEYLESYELRFKKLF